MSTLEGRRSHSTSGLPKMRMSSMAGSFRIVIDEDDQRYAVKSLPGVPCRRLSGLVSQPAATCSQYVLDSCRLLSASLLLHAPSMCWTLVTVCFSPLFWPRRDSFDRVPILDCVACCIYPDPQGSSVQRRLRLGSPGCVLIHRGSSVHGLQGKCGRHQLQARAQPHP